MLCFSPFLLGVLVHRVLHGRKLAILPGCCALLALRCQVLFCCTCAGLYCMQFFLFIGVVFARSATLFLGQLLFFTMLRLVPMALPLLLVLSGGRESGIFAWGRVQWSCPVMLGPNLSHFCHV